MDKFFIFTMGPTGSGKNSLHKKVIEYLGKEYNKNIEEKSFVNLSVLPFHNNSISSLPLNKSNLYLSGNGRFFCIKYYIGLSNFILWKE